MSKAQNPPLWSALRKVLVLFLLGIIAPTAFLVYLGLGAIHTESLLLRKDAQERVGKTARALADHAQGAVDAALAPFEEMIKAAFAEPDALSADAFLRLAEFSRGPGVQNLVILDRDNHLLYPSRDTRRGPRIPLPPLPDPLREELARTETDEFKTQALDQAAASYLTLENQAPDPRWKALLLTSRAGCLSKAHHFDAAQAAYEEILARHSQDLNAEGLPFGLVIGAQLGDLQKLKGRADLAATQYLRLFQDLRSERWDLSWEETQFFARHLQERLASVLPHLSASDQSRVASAQNQWDAYAEMAAAAQESAAIARSAERFCSPMKKKFPPRLS